jgi:hypothetical protein
MAITEAPKLRGSVRAAILDPNKPRGPQIARMAAQMSAILGGPIFGLVGMVRYPLLIPDRALALGGLASLVLWSAVSFLVIGCRLFSKDTPFSTRLKTHLGIGLCATGWMIGAIDIANGYAMPVVTKDVPIAYKRASREADPSYYVGARLWSSPREIVEITVPHELFDRLNVPDTDLETPHPDFGAMPNAGHVQLLVGRGRFGIDWRHGVAPVQPDARQRDGPRS